MWNFPQRVHLPSNPRYSCKKKMFYILFYFYVSLEEHIHSLFFSNSYFLFEDN